MRQEEAMLDKYDKDKTILKKAQDDLCDQFKLQGPRIRGTRIQLSNLTSGIFQPVALNASWYSGTYHVINMSSQF